MRCAESEKDGAEATRLSDPLRPRPEVISAYPHDEMGEGVSSDPQTKQREKRNQDLRGASLERKKKRQRHPAAKKTTGL
jgi:hypothetical protein